MSNRDVEILRDYEALVFERATTKDPRWVTLPNIDWADQPSRFKIYFDVQRRQLTPAKEPVMSFAATFSADGAAPEPLTYERLSQFFAYTNGILSRRMDLNWNSDLINRTQVFAGAHARPAASGGGMYPFELYWVAGAGGPVTSGVYHYDNAHASLEHIRAGDWTGAVREALLGYPDLDVATDFLLISANFWKTAFKYASFTYHIATQDVGSCLATAHLTARALHMRVRTIHWFQDESLNRLLGLTTLSESVFAVVAVDDPGRPAASRRSAPAVAEPGQKSFQRSRRIIRFPLVEQAHEAALLTDEPRPASSATTAANLVAAPAGESVQLPRARLDLLDKPLDKVYRSRHSSFGAFTATGGMNLEDLATILYCSAAGQTLRCDVKPDHPAHRFTRIALFANHVNGLPAGVYIYDAQAHSLVLRAAGDFGRDLQPLYFLENYNLEQTAVTFVIFGELSRMLLAYGNRGVRILNGEVGSVVQSLYLACSALGLGSGAMLGFHNNHMRSLAQLDPSEDPLLIFAAGPELAAPEAFNYRLD